MLVLNSLEIVVFDGKGHPLEGAAVTLQSELLNEVSAAYDTVRQLYFFTDIAPGIYEVRTQLDQFETQTSRVQVHPKPTRHAFVMIPPNTPFIWRGRNRIPFAEDGKRIGVFLAKDKNFLPGEPGNIQLRDFFDQLNVEIESYSINDSSAGWFDGNPFQLRDLEIDKKQTASTLVEGLILRLKNSDEGILENTLGQIRDSQLFIVAGPIFLRNENSVSVFTGRIIIGFRLDATSDDREALIRQLDLEFVNNAAHIPNGVLVISASTVAYQINEITQNLLDSNLVDFAEPELAETPIANSIKPTDYLWSGAWDRILVGAELAWQQLSKKCGQTGCAYGNPEIIMAILDGLPSINGKVEHVDFSGLVSNNSQKIYRLYDFRACAQTTTKLQTFMVWESHQLRLR